MFRKFWRQDSDDLSSGSDAPNLELRSDESEEARSHFPPVFVRGMSRSGTTLLTTLLDAHPEIAMSYEIYPILLRGRQRDSEGTATEYDDLDANELLDILAQPEKEWLKELNEQGLKDIRTFLARALRGGLSANEIVTVLESHARRGLTLCDDEGRMAFIEGLSLQKMKIQGKRRWGCKFSGRYDSYTSNWPDAYYLNILRDGRDVLASQKNTGSFNPEVEKFARSWARSNLDFRELSQTLNVKAMEVKYEVLVQEPEQETVRICEFLEIPFSSEMLKFHEKDLTIFEKPMGHLSLNRVSVPVDASKIGRWKTDLTDEELSAFYEAAGDRMDELGYSKE